MYMRERARESEIITSCKFFSLFLSILLLLLLFSSLYVTSLIERLWIFTKNKILEQEKYHFIFFSFLINIYFIFAIE